MEIIKHSCSAHNSLLIISDAFSFHQEAPRETEKNGLQEQRRPQQQQQTRYLASIRHDEAEESTARWDIHLKRLAFSIFTPLMLQFN